MLRGLRKRWHLKSCLPPDIYVICINVFPSLCHLVFGRCVVEAVWSTVRWRRQRPDAWSTSFEMSKEKKKKQRIQTCKQDGTFHTLISPRGSTKHKRNSSIKSPAAASVDRLHSRHRLVQVETFALLFSSLFQFRR